jgi:uncharacterized CHY-type Zn-finger protein
MRINISHFSLDPWSVNCDSEAAVIHGKCGLFVVAERYGDASCYGSCFLGHSPEQVHPSRSSRRPDVMSPLLPAFCGQSISVKKEARAYCIGRSDLKIKDFKTSMHNNTGPSSSGISNKPHPSLETR